MFESNSCKQKLASSKLILPIVAAFGIVAIVVTACKKTEIFPIIPELTYKSYYFTVDPDNPMDTLLGVIVGYRDGDGDIGLNIGDTFAPFNSIIGPNDVQLNPYYYNLHIDYLTLDENGIYQPVIIPNTTDTFRDLSRIQNITPESKYKAIRGDIDKQIVRPPFSGLSKNVKLKIKIYDRALHESNTIETPPIVLP